MPTANLPISPALAQITPADIDSSVFALVILALFFGFWILMATINSTIKIRERERTTRELAAYIAEGSITPEQAESILSARSRSELREQITQQAAAGWISSKKAKELLESKA